MSRLHERLARSIRATHSKIVRGHFLRLVKLGRSKNDALSDSCYLVAFATWVYLVSALQISGIALPASRFSYVALGVISFFGVHLVHRKLIAKWRGDLELEGASSGLKKAKFSDNAASLVYSLGSVGLFIVSVIALKMLK